MNEVLQHFKCPESNKEQEVFYKKYASQMYRISFRYVTNEQDAGDIVNRGFYNMFNNFRNFVYTNEISLIAWMKRIVINEALMFLRKQINYSYIDLNTIEISTPDNLPEYNLNMEDYYFLIRKLPKDLCTVFNLYAIDGFSHKEIAKELKIEESSSRVYLARARKILQQELIKK